MKVISAIYNEKKNAGPKAPSDIDFILKEKYGAKCFSFSREGNYKIKLLIEFIKARISNEICVIQYPALYIPIAYNILLPSKTIILIHDINGLREQDKKKLDKDIKVLKKFKYIISHNQSMSNFLEEKGISKERIYNLDLFDYIVNDIKINNETNKKENNELTLFYPGNLKKVKSPFIYQLDEEKMKFKINLYGLGIEKINNNKLIYKGSFSPNDLSNVSGDIGLIWDGNFDESDENYKYKNYTKYNNPHKLSCCLALEKPVIVWKKAAIAEFVLKNNIGYAINNLYDINNIDFSDYNQKKYNATIIGKKVKRGDYTTDVFDEIINKIKNEERVIK